MGTIGIIKLLEIFGYKSGIRFKDLIFISYAGLIRGAVAFGLVLRIDERVENRSVIITTSLSLVVFTTVVLGSTVATMSKILFGKEIEEKRRLEQLKHPINLEESRHEIFLHPGFDESIDEKTPTNKSPIVKKISKKGQCVKKMRDLEKKFVKPCLIYKFDPKE